MDENVPR